MTNPDYRAMCAELVDAWDALPWEYDWLGNAIGAHGKLCDDSVVDRARALLDQEPVSPPYKLPQPVAVSERLPGDVLSWWYEPDEDDDEGYGGKWTLLRIRGAAYTYTHWLPANALPIPEATND